MDEIFNPSLIISLGPSSNKALLYAKKLLLNIPEAFLEVIDFYDVQDINSVSKDIQEIVDTKLLSAKALNKLVDMGYKVRSENISSVRLNIYILWEIYESSISVLKVVKLLSELNYGNIDNSQHSGVSIFVIPILEKEWTIKEKHNAEAIEELSQLKDYLCLKENMLKMDSKIYLLHSVANDGTRIPKEELQYISAIMVYLNIIPSKEPPLSSYKRRVLMHEGNYKVGTIGITALLVFKDRLKDSFSMFITHNIIKHAIGYENNTSFQDCKALKLLDLKNETKVIREKLNYIDDAGKLKLLDSKLEEIVLTKNTLEYPELLKGWKDEIELNYVPQLKEKINAEVKRVTEKIIRGIDEEIEEVCATYSLKEGLNYLQSALINISIDNLEQKMVKGHNFLSLDNKLKSQVERCTDLTHFLIRGALLASFLSLILICFVIPHTSGVLKIFSISAFVLMGFALVFLNYEYNIKKLNILIDEYKNEFLKAEGGLLSVFIENCVVQEHEKLRGYIAEIEQSVLNSIKALEELEKSLIPIAFKEEGFLGNLITELLNPEDRYKFYNEKCLSFQELYRTFIDGVCTYKAIVEEATKEKLLEVSNDAADNLGDMDFYEYFQFKYKENSSAQLYKWISRGLVKSKQLLQYVNTNLEEEHLSLIASSQIVKLLIQSEESKFSNLYLSPTVSEDVNINCMAIVRLCIGLELDNIIPIRTKLKE